MVDDISPARMPKFLEKVCEEVGARYDASFGELIGDSKEARIVRARWLIWAIAQWHDPIRYSKARLGRYFGKDHSTIINGLRRHGIPAKKPPPAPGRPPKDRSALIAAMIAEGYSQTDVQYGARFGCSGRVVSRLRTKLRRAGRWPHSPAKPWAAASRQLAARRAAAGEAAQRDQKAPR